VSTGSFNVGDLNRDGKVSKWEWVALGVVALAVLQVATKLIEACGP
jgi:hypothetical protein